MRGRNRRRQSRQGRQKQRRQSVVPDVPAPVMFPARLAVGLVWCNANNVKGRAVIVPIAGARGGLTARLVMAQVKVSAVSVRGQDVRKKHRLEILLLPAVTMGDRKSLSVPPAAAKDERMSVKTAGARDMIQR